MSKQNRVNPKYILLSTPTQSNTQTFKSIKLGSLHNKTMQSTQKSIFKKYQSPQPIIKKEAFKSLNKQVTADIDNVRTLLSECMNNMVIQEKRNLTLKNLIGILELQMKKMEENEKQLHKIQDQQNLKKAQKVQYDIEQILQKYNEEIAKINCLKQQTFSARSDRVVFSNLFKKIEKEIKHNVDQYKQFILKTQMNRQRKALKQQAQQYQLSKHQSIDEVQQRDDTVQHQFNKIEARQVLPQDSKLFLTSLNHKGGMNSNKLLKKVSHRIGFANDNGSSNKLLGMIEQLETKIQKISKIAECDSCEEAIKLYSNIEDQGQKLLSLISLEDQKIEQIQSEIERIKLQKRISQIYDENHLQKLQSIPSTRKIRSMKFLKTTLTEQSERNEQNLQIMSQIFQLFSAPSDRSIILNQQTLEMIEHHIETLFIAKTFKKSDSNISLTNSPNHDLDNILNKMDKFDSCDRILNRKQFYNEYTRELNKSKKCLKAKK